MCERRLLHVAASVTCGYSLQHIRRRHRLVDRRRHLLALLGRRATSRSRSRVAGQWLIVPQGGSSRSGAERSLWRAASWPKASVPSCAFDPNPNPNPNPNTGAARALYGPSSPYAEFVADSCSKEITIVGCFGDGCTATVLNGVPPCGKQAGRRPSRWLAEAGCPLGQSEA